MKGIEDIHYILYDRGEKESRIVRAFRELRAEKLTYRDNPEPLLDELKMMGVDSHSLILLSSFRGRSWQMCPGSPGMICCNYQLINTCFGCLYDCTYCFLQLYLESYGIMQFTGVDEEIEMLPERVPVREGWVSRLGTGEFTDSLMMDRVTGIARRVTETMRERRDVFLEFKTKSYNIDHLLDMDPAEIVVMAWSLNTPFAIEQYEKDTASLEERLSAAGRAAGAGFLLAFHFDPMIIYPDHLEEYLKVVDRMMNSVPPERVAWVSLGCFRYVPGFPDAMRVRFPDEKMTFPEMVPGLDGKYRYLKPKRVELYEKMMDRIRQYDSRIFVYLCMESDDIWYRLTGRDYANPRELEKELSDNLIFRFR